MPLVAIKGIHIGEIQSPYQVLPDKLEKSEKIMTTFKLQLALTFVAICTSQISSAEKKTPQLNSYREPITFTLQVNEPPPNPIRFCLFAPKSEQPAQGVFVALFAGYENALGKINAVFDGNAQQNEHSLIRWAMANHFAIATWDTHYRQFERPWWGMRCEDLTPQIIRDRTTFIDAYCQSMHQGLDRLCREASIPPDASFALAGNSKGAYWGRRFLLRYPQRFFAGLVHNGHSYERHALVAPSVVMHYSSGEYDGGRSQTMECFERRIGQPGVAFIYADPAVGHALPTDEELRQSQFLDQMFRQRQSSPDWANRLRIRLDRSKWVYDFVNQTITPRDQADWVPPAQIQPLTDELVDLWR